MDIAALRAFCAVADGDTVTAIAEEMYVTQPALSRTLERVAHEVGAPLLHRVGRRLHLTPAGMAFLEYARRSVDAYDAGVRVVSERTDPEQGMIALSFLHTLGTWLVPDVIRAFRTAHPGARFQLVQHGDPVLLDDLFLGVSDLVLTTDADGDPRVVWEPLLEEPLALAVPSDHRLARRDTVRLADAAAEPFVLLGADYALRKRAEALCATAGFVPDVQFESDEVETLRGLVSAGLGVSIVPFPHGGASEDVGGVKHLRVRDVRSSRSIGVARLAGAALPELTEAFLVTAREVAARS